MQVYIKFIQHSMAESSAYTKVECGVGNIVGRNKFISPRISAPNATF